MEEKREGKEKKKEECIERGKEALFNPNLPWCMTFSEYIHSKLHTFFVMEKEHVGFFFRSTAIAQIDAIEKLKYNTRHTRQNNKILALKVQPS